MGPNSTQKTAFYAQPGRFSRNGAILQYRARGLGGGGVYAPSRPDPIDRLDRPPARPETPRPMRSRDPDARLAERALREAWPVPEGRRASWWPS